MVASLSKRFLAEANNLGSKTMLKTQTKCIIFEIWFLVGIVTSMAQSTKAAESIGYGARGFENDNFLAIVAGGNKRDRTAYLTVFEVLASDRRLRRLHQTKLLNGCSPKSFQLCGSGRFFLSMNEWKDPRISKYPLVIYDLVRREHTVYRLKEFLPDSVYSTDGENWVNWFPTPYHGLRFNPDTMEFYINEINKERPPSHTRPFIVVDLPTRTVRVEPPKTNAPNPYDVPRLSKGWRVSIGIDDGHSDKADTPPRMLPRLLRYGIWEDNKIEIKAYTYRLNSETEEYHLVPNEEWIENYRLGSCTETHVEDP